MRCEGDEDEQDDGVELLHDKLPRLRDDAGAEDRADTCAVEHGEFSDSPARYSFCSVFSR